MDENIEGWKGKLQNLLQYYRLILVKKVKRRNVNRPYLPVES